MILSSKTPNIPMSQLIPWSKIPRQDPSIPTDHTSRVFRTQPSHPGPKEHPGMKTQVSTHSDVSRYHSGKYCPRRRPNLDSECTGDSKKAKEAAGYLMRLQNGVRGCSILRKVLYTGGRQLEFTGGGGAPLPPSLPGRSIRDSSPPPAPLACWRCSGDAGVVLLVLGWCC